MKDMKLRTDWISDIRRRQYIWGGLVRDLVKYCGFKESIKTVSETRNGHRIVFLSESCRTLLEVEFTPEMDELLTPLILAIIRQARAYNEKEN